MGCCSNSFHQILEREFRPTLCTDSSKWVSNECIKLKRSDVLGQAGLLEYREDPLKTDLERQGHVIGKGQRRRSGASFGPVDRDEIGTLVPLDHPPGQFIPELQLPDGTLDPHRQPRAISNPLDEIHEFIDRAELGMRVGRETVFADGDSADFGDFGCHLRSGQNPSLARLGTLGQLDLYGTDLGTRLDLLAKPVERKATVSVSGTEITGSQLPDHVGPESMIGTDAAFTGVVVTTGRLGSLVQG